MPRGGLLRTPRPAGRRRSTKPSGGRTSSLGEKKPSRYLPRSHFHNYLHGASLFRQIICQLATLRIKTYRLLFLSVPILVGGAYSQSHYHRPYLVLGSEYFGTVQRAVPRALARFFVWTSFGVASTFRTRTPSSTLP